MNILTEKESVVVNLEIEYTDEEVDILLKYAHDHMSEDDKQGLLMEWSLIEIIKDSIKPIEGEGEGESP